MILFVFRLLNFYIDFRLFISDLVRNFFFWVVISFGLFYRFILYYYPSQLFVIHLYYVLGIYFACFVFLSGILMISLLLYYLFVAVIDDFIKVHKRND